MDDQPTVLTKMAEDKLIRSYAEGRRLLAQGAVFVNGKMVKSENTTISDEDQIKIRRKK